MKRTAKTGAAEKQPATARQPGNERFPHEQFCPIHRREFESSTKAFVAARSGRPSTNAPFYRAFYALQDELGFALIKVAGHCRAVSRNSVERIFSYIDQEARRALSLWMGEIGDEFIGGK